MKKDIKYIFCDLDGTLLTDDKYLSEKNIVAINKVKEAGIKFVIATGRMPYLIDQIMNVTGKEEDEYAICANGAVIYQGNGTIISSKPIDSNCVEAIKSVARERHIGLFVSNEKCVRCYNQSVIETTKVEKHITLVELNDEQLDEFTSVPIYKMSLIHSDPQILNDVSKYLDRVANGRIKQAKSSITTVEIVGDGCTKGEGIARFCEMQNVDLDEVIVIGDNMNDMSMFMKAGCKACPANGCEQIKEMANYIAKNDNNNSAVAEIIEKFILN